MKVWRAAQGVFASRFFWPLLAGIYVFFVPTVFTVVPGWTRWNGWFRVLVLVSWATAAAYGVFVGLLRDQRLEVLTAQRREVQRQLRSRALLEIVQSLLHPGAHGIPDHYTFTVYLYDSDSDQLVPWLPPLRPPIDPDPRIFPVGKGATGLAFQDRTIVVVRGADVTNSAYGLTPQQQAYFAGCRNVAAAPIADDLGRLLGSLTAITRRADNYFSEPQHLDSIRALADAIGVVLRALPEGVGLG